MEKGEVQVQCEHCNDKKMNSKRVQELSSELYFSAFVKECGPLEEEGMVMAVLDHSFDVLVLKLGVVKRVYCEVYTARLKSSITELPTGTRSYGMIIHRHVAMYCIL